MNDSKPINFQSVLDSYNRQLGVLSKAVKDDAEETANSIDRRIVELTEVARTYDAVTREEKLLQIEFFLQKLSTTFNIPDDSETFRTVRQLIEKLGSD
ncbi:MAG: hypothetical protein GY732_19935 [Gammaproteobacteria bacterium]|nr:hypothetical protein [Gammaproteobacteria bacterium]